MSDLDPPQLRLLREALGELERARSLSSGSVADALSKLKMAKAQVDHWLGHTTNLCAMAVTGDVLDAAREQAEHARSCQARITLACFVLGDRDSVDPELAREVLEVRIREVVVTVLKGKE